MIILQDAQSINPYIANVKVTSYCEEVEIDEGNIGYVDATLPLT